MQIPDPVTFFTKTPLYKSFNLTDKDNYKYATDIFNFSESFDAYCIDCGKDTTYQPQTQYSRLGLNVTENCNDDYSRVFLCTRNKNHKLTIHFKVLGVKFIKIGLFPTVADLSNHEYRKYKGVLDNQDYSELNKAVGLVSHGIGIGSFVYLRRIFENLVEEAHKSAFKSLEWNEEKYVMSRMDEKVLMLKNYLPDFLVVNRSIYSILSKGIHSLDEQECLDHFDIIKTSIELILDERIEKKLKEKKIKEATAKISSLAQRLKNNASG